MCVLIFSTTYFWNMPVIVIVEWVQLYLMDPYATSWCGHGQIYLFVIIENDGEA